MNDSAWVTKQVMPLFLVRQKSFHAAATPTTRQNSTEFGKIPHNILINRLAWRLAWEISECSILEHQGYIAQKLKREALAKEMEEALAKEKEEALAKEKVEEYVVCC